MVYDLNLRVRYSECNMKKEVKLTSLFDYLQDCCTMQSEDLGIGVDYLWEKKRAWVLSSIQVDIKRIPTLGEKIIVHTIPYEIKNYFGLRSFYITDEKGDNLLLANSFWTFIDTESGRPVKVDEIMETAYATGERIEMEYLDRKIKMPAESELKEKIVIPEYFIDTNGHVNNTKYILMAENFLPLDFSVGRVQAEYKKAAKQEDVIYPAITIEENKIYVGLNGEDGKPFANVVFWQGKE